jgi:uncharacterized RDD family membrane protein YckC
MKEPHRMSEQQANPPASFPKRVFALILDTVTIFSLAGYLIGWLTGNLTPNGFQLDGMPAWLWLATIVAYFYIGRTIAGGTLWDRILGIARPQPY